MTKFTFRELAEHETFDPLTIWAETPFTQAAFYGAWQKSLGRRVRRFVVSNGDDEIVAYFQLICFPLIHGKNYLYLPYGPVTKISTPDFLATLKRKLQEIAQEENAVFVRLDFTPKINPTDLEKFFRPSSLATYHSAYFQPRTEWWLKLGEPLEKMFERLDKKTRYSIRTAEKRGVTTEIVTKDFQKYFADFYELLAETAKRDHFQLHPRAYYASIFANLENNPGAYLIIARHRQEILVIDVIIHYGQVANYVFGASSNAERQLLPSYLAQWTAIGEARKRGAADYNFGGIATASGAYRDWDGLSAFKKKFGGRAMTHSDFFDLVISPFWYFLYNLRKRLKSVRLGR